ncbi:hypothetical protein KAU37_00595 [Candidatus Bipolaricaulota bacterium]|nr:hypothetical protein [Candidatus Bipolaricaulota bacterium]
MNSRSETQTSTRVVEQACRKSRRRRHIEEKRRDKWPVSTWAPNRPTFDRWINRIDRSRQAGLGRIVR